MYVTNGTSSSTGGITTTAGALVVTPPAGSRAGYIYLNAQNGVMTIPGTLSANGGTSDGAGVIGLLAKTVAFGTNAVVSANQSSGVAGTLHGVLIAAETITYQGSSGLTLSGNGDGADQFSNGYVQVFTKGSVTITDTLDPLNLAIDGVLGTVTGNVTFQGSGTAPLLMRADGNNSKVYLFGTKLTFTGGKVTLQSKGATNHSVQISNQNTTAGLVGVAFSGTGAVKLDVEGVSGAGGDIKLYTDKVTLDAPSFTFSANGPTAASGNSGTIIVSTNGTTLKPTSKVTMTANGSSFGTGDSIASDPTGFDPRAITFYPGAMTIDIGTATAAGQYTFQAKGGKSGGHGGTIAISAQGATLKTAAAMNASALAGNSDGGEIYFGNYITSIAPTATVTAIGKGTGKGGKFTAFHSIPTLAVNTIVKVDGGTSLLSSSEADYGRIKLNNVTCQQRTTGLSSGTKTYWNCANPTGSTADETAMRTAIAGLPSSFRTTLGANSVGFYVFSINTDYNIFYGDAIPPVVGNSNSGRKLAMVFESTGSGINYAPYLPGNMMHEIGHLLNAYTNPTPTGTTAWSTKKSATETAMRGTWPNPQSPTCLQVYNDAAVCNAQPNKSPYQILLDVYIGGQDENLEIFAFAFQNCSGHMVQNNGLNNAERSIYMRDVFDYMNVTFWPGGCVWQP